MKVSRVLLLTAAFMSSVSMMYASGLWFDNPTITTSSSNARGNIFLESNCATGCGIITDIHFYGNNTNGVEKEFSVIETYGTDLTPGGEEGTTRFIALHDGTPISYLEFNNGGNNQVLSFVDFAVSEGKKIFLDSGTGNEWFDKTAGTNKIRIVSGGTPAMTIEPTKVVVTAGHKLGINTDTPSEELDVVGDIKLSGNIVSSGPINIIPNGDICIGTGC